MTIRGETVHDPRNSLRHAASCGVEARCSILSVRGVCGLRPITVFTDCAGNSGDLDVDIRCVGTARLGFQDKVEWIPQSPYDETLFLDTDTLVLRDDAVDVRAAHAVRHGRGAGVRAAVPAGGSAKAFAELNSGVILFRKSEEVDRLLRRWRWRYREAADVANWMENPKGSATSRSCRRSCGSAVCGSPRCRPSGTTGDSATVQDFSTIRILHHREAQRRACRVDRRLDREALLEWFRED